jgi:hypothetical protein
MASDYDYDHFTQGTKWVIVMVIGHSRKKNNKPKNEN